MLWSFTSTSRDRNPQAPTRWGFLRVLKQNFLQAKGFACVSGVSRLQGHTCQGSLAAGRSSTSGSHLPVPPCCLPALGTPLSIKAKA